MEIRMQDGITIQRLITVPLNGGRVQIFGNYSKKSMFFSGRN
jgi:hypothetical protein